MNKNALSFGMFLLTITAIPLTQTFACTIVSVSMGDKVLYGNNEDWYLPNTFIWFVPAQENAHGYCYVGYDENDHQWDGNPQGGMNDQGLTFDYNALPPSVLIANTAKTPYPSDYNGPRYFMERYSSVNEIRDFYLNIGYPFNLSITWQQHWADATGDAAVVSVGPDGAWTATGKGNASYLVSTNWNRANPESGDFIGWRYETATTMLDNITQEDQLTVDAVRRILEACHQEGQYPTLYSNIFDLVNGDIYLYYDHDFSKVVKINLEEELAKGYHRFKIADLFEYQASKVSSPSSQASSESSSALRSMSTAASSRGFELAITAIVLALVGTIVIKRRQ
ncbi:MAG: carcinine hydrolase/isopenicillin-N N-acyltransferase family protein [Candidatus Heimdallarchaeota archaeon]